MTSSRQVTVVPRSSLAWLVAAGFAVSLACVLWASWQRGWTDDERFLLWAVPAASIGAVAGAVADDGIRQAREVARIAASLGREGAVRDRSALRLVGLGIATTTAFVLYPLARSPSPGAARGAIVTLTAVLAGAPVAIAMASIPGALAGAGAEPLPRRLAAYLELRALGERLLRPLGALLALTLFSLGAARLLPPVGGAAPAPPEVLLLFGATGTAAIGLLYGVPRASLRREARAVVELLAPLESETAKGLCGELEARDGVERRLGLYRGLLDELQSGVTVAGPLIGAAVSSVLGW